MNRHRDRLLPRSNRAIGLDNGGFRRGEEHHEARQIALEQHQVGDVQADQHHEQGGEPLMRFAKPATFAALAAPTALSAQTESV